jgi:hypothetical protein
MRCRLPFDIEIELLAEEAAYALAKPATSGMAATLIVSAVTRPFRAAVAETRICPAGNRSGSRARNRLEGSAVCHKTFTIYFTQVNENGRRIGLTLKHLPVTRSHPTRLTQISRPMGRKQLERCHDRAVRRRTVAH